MNPANDLALSSSDATQLVPASFAEKAMASLMQLHTELMDEKERRVDLFRRLMEREQALAELKMYVKMLEEKAGAAAAPVPVTIQPPPPPTPPSAHPPPPAVPFVARTAPSVRASFQAPPRPLITKPIPDGWKTW
jgi:hypothetical protein